MSNATAPNKKPGLSPSAKAAKLKEAGYSEETHESRIRETQKQLAARGYITVKLNPASKAPVGHGWQERGHPNNESYTGYHNIGVILGEKSGGLVDIDIDDDNLLDVMGEFLPPTPTRFGRFYGQETQRLGHWLYRVEVPGKMEKIKGPTGATAVEYRSDGGQTMFPTSAIWDENLNEGAGGIDCILWANKERKVPSDEPTLATNKYLTQAIRITTISYYAAAYFKKHSYHDDMLAWCGFLLRSGIEEDLVVKSVRYLVEATGQNDLEDRLNSIKTTLARIEAGEHDLRGINYLEYDAGWDKPFCAWLRRTIGVKKEELSDGRPKILIVESKETEWVDKTLDAMVDTKKFYNQSGQIVTVVKEHGESVKLIPLTDSVSSASWLTREILFTKNVLDKATQQFTESKIVCPKSVALEIANVSTSKGRVLPIMGTCNTPVITRTGRIIDEAWEYDHELKTFFACEHGVTSMYRDEAIHALSETLCDFPFTYGSTAHHSEDETPRFNRYKAAALSAIMTAVVRPALDICPMYVITSSQHSDGKSVLSGVIAASVGVEASLGQLTRGGSDEEQEKQLSAILSRGRRVVTLDNHDGEFRSAALTEALTSVNPEFRVLGKNETRSIYNKTMFILNGVNTVPALDLQTRCVTIKMARTNLDPNRKFKHLDVVGYAYNNREKLVSAAINLIEWALKQPDGDWKPNHRFKVWDQMIRRTVLLACGVDIAPPVTEDEDRSLDPVEEARHSLLTFVLQQWLLGMRSKDSVRKVYFRSADLANLIPVDSEEEGWVNVLSKRPKQQLSYKCGYALNAVKEFPVKWEDGSIWRLEGYTVASKSAYRVVQVS